MTRWTVAPVHFVARREAGLVGAQALVLGQQRRVDVDDPAFPAGEEVVGDDAHEAGQRDQIDVRPLPALRGACPRSWRRAPWRRALRTSERPRLRPSARPGASGLSPVTSATS